MMRFTTLLLPACLVGVAAAATGVAAQVIRIEAESGALNGFSILEFPFFSAGAATNAEVASPTATYTFTGWNGPYDIRVGYCDEDDGTSSYTLSGSSSGTIASWLGDQPTGTNNCSPTSLLTREVTASVTLEQGETITLACQRDGLEPCRTDYFDFTYIGPMPPVGESAFPGAMGFGAGTSGARGLDGDVCLVDSLADGGPGSFRACAEQVAPAYIIFTVSGYIDLTHEVHIMGNKTIECATAPGDGVVFRRASLDVFGDNVIVRGCRVWAGKEPGGEPLIARDGIIVQNPNVLVKHSIIANSSMLFATDENAGTWYPATNVTLQDNIVAWGIEWIDENGNDQVGKGLLIGDDAQNISAIGNYMAFNRYRSPLVKLATRIEVINNLVYCRYIEATDLLSVIPSHVIGNRYKRCSGFHGGEIRLRGDTLAYVADNTMNDGSDPSMEVDQTSEISPDPLFISTVTPIPSSGVESHVFASVGPARRIAFEVGALENYVNGAGGIIDSVDDLGGWPTLEVGANPPDSDGDGMPNWWESAHCDGACTPTGDHDGDGYENIEEWFHSFYGRRAPAQLEVDSSPLSSNGNGVFEPGEQVDIAPSWRNDAELPLTLDGIASDFDGPGGASYTVIADGASYGTVDPGETASCEDTGICYAMGLSDPPSRPVNHWDATFDETLSEATTKTWTAHVGDSFVDVPPTHAFYLAVETMLHHGVTSGCGGASYCPAATVTRGQMPVFLLKANDGPNYQPPACVAADEQFDDVLASNPLCRWIEELADRGVVSGCGGGDYCPSNPVTRAQMAVVLLRTLEGASYTPPTCAGIFNDVACPSLFADWVEDVYIRGIAGGCSSSPPKYCPSGAVNRGQMAVLVRNTFGLALYEP